MLLNFQGMVRIKMRFTGKLCFVNFQSYLIVINEGKFLLSFPALKAQHNFHLQVDAQSREMIHYPLSIKNNWGGGSINHNNKKPTLKVKDQWRIEDSYPSFLLKTQNCNYPSTLSHLPFLYWKLDSSKWFYRGRFYDGIIDKLDLERQMTSFSSCLISWKFWKKTKKLFF